MAGGSASRLTAAPPVRAYQLPQPQPSPPLQHPSPQAQQSPSTVEASPLLTPVPPNFNGHVETTGRHVITEKARASIACTSCRRNKTRCRNKNDGSICEACEERGKVCDYQTASPATGSGSYPSKRRESTIGEVDNSTKKRKRILAPTSRAGHSPHDIVRIHEDILDSPWLTPKVWGELFDIYERHFAADFPFLHRRRFLQPLHQTPLTGSAATKEDFISLPRPPHTPPLLLAFLTQTARYHPVLLSRVDPKPIATAEFFANATQKRLGPDTCEASLENAQALLFLGFHRWSDLKGQKGWILMASAVNYTRISRYQYDEARRTKAKIDKTRRGKTEKEGRIKDDDDEFTQQEHFIDREIHRRTFWSCFILDRYLSCGKDRPQLLAKRECNIPLPCSDKAFSRGQKVRTRHLGENDEKYAQRRQRSEDSIRRSHEHAKIFHQNDNQVVEIDEVEKELDGEWEVGNDENELNQYIQAAEHFGRCLEWSNRRGRRGEEFPPWDDRCGFKKLEEDNQRLHNALPKHLMLTPRNTNTHISYKTSRNYILIHALHTLCTIALYREYMAFKPWNLKKPEGPLDEPKITESPPEDQPNYWITQARRCFGAAKDFADLLKTCQSADALVDSPIAGWATYIVTWCAVYCHFFHRMDPDGALDSRKNPNARDLVDIIIDMQNRVTMASQWGHILVRLNIYLNEERAKWIDLGGSPGSTTSDSVGGLSDYSNFFESEHKEFGSLADKSWSHKPIIRSDLELVHHGEVEDRGELPSPVIIYKREATPASMSTPGFNAVNRVDGANSTGQTPAPSPQNHNSRVFDPHVSAGSIQVARANHPSYNTHGVPPITPLVETVGTSSTYGSGPGTYRPVTQTTYNSHPNQNQTAEDESVRFDAQACWLQQQAPQPGPTLEQMQLAGQYGVDMSDINSLQRAESIFAPGSVYLDYLSGSWFNHFQQNHSGPFPTGSANANDPDMNAG